MAHLPCWNCRQPATHTLTRDGSTPLDACDNCTRIDREQAQRQGWTITPINPEETAPMTTTDFFEPGTTYRRGRWLFQCLAVAPRPFNQEPRAVGFLYRPTEPDTTTGLDAADWEHGEWAPAPECPHCGAPADASGCHIPQHDPRCPTHDPHF